MIYMAEERNVNAATYSIYTVFVFIGFSLPEPGYYAPRSSTSSPKTILKAGMDDPKIKDQNKPFHRSTLSQEVEYRFNISQKGASSVSANSKFSSCYSAFGL